MLKGRVYLVGAGPGDTGLITLRAVELLSQAEVVVYDNLVDELLLEHAPGSAERIYAGKSASRHALEQDEINALLVRRAQQGKTVVRLKGGDPFVLGRGGEEAEALAREGIHFEVVPGVTSAIAVPAYAGIPVTQRGLSSSFAVITGHEDPSKRDSSLRWEKLATAVDTLVFLMGMGNLAQIAGKLIEHGRNPDTPVAVIREGATPRQVTLTGSLRDIAERVKQANLGPPAVIIIGEVVRLRDKLRWYDNRPLSGRRVLITRPALQASKLEKLLAERGAAPLRLPSIEIRPQTTYAKLDKAIRNIRDYDWLVLTSVNGAAAFFARLKQCGRDARWLCGLKIAAIGPATGAALQEHGIMPDLVPQEFTSAGLLQSLGKKSCAGKRFLLARADIADRELAEGLARLGAKVEDLAVYRTIRLRHGRQRLINFLEENAIEVITFTSASTVQGFVRDLTSEDLGRLKAKTACIGVKTAQAAVSAGLRADIVAGQSDLKGLVRAMEEYYREVS